MANRDDQHPVIVELLGDDDLIPLSSLASACQIPAERVLELVAQGVIEPVPDSRQRWLFQSISIRRVRCAERLRRDLGVNTAGAALALDLLDEIRQLRARLRQQG